MFLTPDLRCRFAATLAMTLLFLLPAQAQHGWPVEPANSDHPMGNSYGEYYGTVQHVGIDLMERPMYDASNNVDAAAPWVIVTVPGDVLTRDDVANSLYNFTSIDPTDAADTATYLYGHLQQGSYHVDYTNAFNNGTAVAAGDRIARIVRWSACGFHHTHYQLEDGTNYRNPLAAITPNPDVAPPVIEDIHFAQDNSDPWVPFQPVAGDACTVVSGKVDVVAQARDRDEAGASLGDIGELWIYNIRWRVCPDTNPSCAWQNTRPFDTIPYSWYTSGNADSKAQFSTRTPWLSNESYCNAGWKYPIVTNYVSGAVNVLGSWDTTALPDGSYTVSVELTDYAGNATVFNRRACVQNAAAGTTELTIRDWTDDDGGIPYEGPCWWVSPDITANPGTPDEDQNIHLDADNPIAVRVWNYGSAALPAGTTYDVCLGWGLPSSAVAYPLPASQQIAAQTETVPAGGWPVGTSRTTTITWHPASASVPQGHHCLVAWVNALPDDPVLNTPAVNQDDNRAQQNIIFESAPGPGRAGYAYFWVNPQAMMKDRSLELKFRYPLNRPTLSRVRLHVPPGLRVQRVTGGKLEGGYRGDQPKGRTALGSQELRQLQRTPWEKTNDLGFTRIIGGIPLNGRLVLEGIEPVRKPVRLTLEVWSAKKVLRGQFADVEVIEYGTLRGQESKTPVGGLTVRFKH